jgi:hypothetical protein
MDRRFAAMTIVRALPLVTVEGRNTVDVDWVGESRREIGAEARPP